MGLTGGNVDDGIDNDDDEKRNNVSFLVLHKLHSTFVANPFHITHVQMGDCAHFLSPALCWTEYYMEHGCDVYLFYYAGYGRSSGGSSWNQTTTEFSREFLGTLKRGPLQYIPSFQAVVGVSQARCRHRCTTHRRRRYRGSMNSSFTGESIGGMAAAGAAKALTAASSSQHPNVLTILPWDRTFCNLEAVAQRLVGQCHTPPDAGMEHRRGTRLLSGEMSQDRSAKQRRRDYSRLFISEIWTGVRGGVDQRPAEENRMDHVPADGIPDCGFRQR